MVADVGDAGVGDQVAAAEDDEATAAHTEVEAFAHGDAFCGSDDAETVFGFHTGKRADVDAGVVAGDNAVAVAAFAPSGFGAGGEGERGESAAERAAGIGADAAGGAEAESDTEIKECLGDGVRLEGADDEFTIFGDISAPVS